MSIELSRILVPTDFSDSARLATDNALELARAFDASLCLLHVIEDPILAIPALVGYAPDADELEQFSETALANWILPEDARGITIERFREHGHPVPRILDFARTHDCDLIVLGRHGHSPVIQALIGSVAEKVVRKAPCPVLCVGPRSLATANRDASASVPS